MLFDGEAIMAVEGALWVIGVLVAYVVLMRWVLPRFGVAT
jgi:hypothetical protein